MKNVENGLKKEDLLPEGWEAVSYKQRMRHRDSQIVDFLLEVSMVEQCYGCDALRTFTRGGALFSYCIFAKCIKEYPTYSDRKEFK